MKHLALGLFMVLTVLILVCTFGSADAWAHGGQFRGPGDQVPPGLRDPYDPTPPPPPPPPSPAPTPVTPTGGGMTPVTPVQGAPPVMTPPTAPTGGRRLTKSMSFADWVFWYHYNKDDIENLKWRLYNRLSTDVPIFQVDHESGSAQGDARRRMTQKQVKRIVVPALLWAMDPANVNYSDIEGAAYIALAKVSDDPAHIEQIQQGLDRQARRDTVVQESVALALGMLRRTEPGRQFTARELDKVRAFLFDVFENADYGRRVRGFAAISIGLLGDQPTGSGEYANETVAASLATTRRLFELLEARYVHDDLYVALMLAIGLQTPTSVTPDQRELLGDCALKGRLYGEKASDVTSAYAALALGRIGTAADIRTLEGILTSRSRQNKQHAQRSAAIGLGLLGRLVTGEDRVRATQVLLRTIDRSKDASTVNYALISLAHLLIEDARARRTDVLGNTRAEETLFERAEKGRPLERGFGAIGLGLVLREMSDELDVEVWQEFRERATLVLRAGLSRKGQDKRTRAAYATALGIAGDDRSRETLRKILDDRRGDKALRSYAALALGLIGNPSGEVSRSVAQALRERSSDDLRRQAATALGLLGNPQIPGAGKDAVDILIAELKTARTQSHKGQIVLALARVGDHRALAALEEIVKDGQENPLTRALACAGLGLVGDLEWIPSIARGSKDINYRASTDLVNEFLSIL